MNKLKTVNAVLGQNKDLNDVSNLFIYLYFMLLFLHKMCVYLFFKILYGPLNSGRET